MAITGKVRARRGHLAAAVRAVVNGIIWADPKGQRRSARAAVVDPLESRVFLSTSSLPAWLSPSSAATWDADTHALNVTGTATIVADPGADEPLVTVSGPAAALTIRPATDTWVHLGSLTLLGGGSAELTRPSAGAFTESGSLVLELGPAGGTSGSPLLSVDAAAGSTLGIEDNDLIVRGAEAYAQDFLRSVAVQANGMVPPGGVALDPNAYHSDGLIIPGWSAAAADWSVEDRTLWLAPGDVLSKFTPLGHDDAPTWADLDAPAPAAGQTGPAYPAYPGPTLVREQVGPAYPASFFASSLDQPALASGPTPASVSSVVVNGIDTLTCSARSGRWWMTCCTRSASRSRSTQPARHRSEPRLGRGEPGPQRGRHPVGGHVHRPQRHEPLDRQRRLLACAQHQRSDKRGGPEPARGRPQPGPVLPPLRRRRRQRHGG